MVGCTTGCSTYHHSHHQSYYSARNGYSGLLQLLVVTTGILGATTTVATKSTAVAVRSIAGKASVFPSFRRPTVQSIGFCSHSRRGSAAYVANRGGASRTFAAEGRRRGTTEPTSSLSSSPYSFAEDPSSDPDADYWEKLYAAGSPSQKIADAYYPGVPLELVEGGSEETSAGTATSPMEVRVVTFDLDDTLWRTSATIGAANAALESYLETVLPSSRAAVRDTMGRLFRENPTRYTPTFVPPSVDGDGEEKLPDPVLLTLLRTDAIRSICLEDSAMEPNRADEIATAGFECWTAARHAAIPEKLARGAVETMARVRSVLPPGRAVVGAITNGNSDPFRVPALAQHFDFVVRSEDVGVAKPDKQVFIAAVRAVQKRCPGIVTALEGLEDGSDADLEDTIGPWWVHVGDDFMKDCAAAKALGMRTVWARELVVPHPSMQMQDPDMNAPPKASDNNNDNNLLKFDGRREAKTGAIRMYLGADDYLLDEMVGEFVDAQLDAFDLLPDVLSQWQEEAQNDMEYNLEKRHMYEDLDPIRETTLNPPPVLEKQENFVSKKGNKFCIHCGTSISVVAKFCSACGEPQ